MRKLLVIGAVLATLFVGCSDDEPESTATVAPEQTEQASTGPAATRNDHGEERITDTPFDLELELDDFYFAPTRIVVPGDSTAMITLNNEGDIEHTFTMDALAISEEVQPGDSKEIEVEIGTETRYEFYCRYHRSQGMSGEFSPH